MDPDVPADAQRIVAAYLKLIEAHASENVYPGSLRDLALLAVVSRSCSIQHAQRRWIRKYARPFGLIYQPSMLHQKLMVVDRRWSVPRTTNIDMMSFEYLDEINIAVIDETFAKELQAQHDVDLARSIDLTLPSRRRSAWEKALAEAVWTAAGQSWVQRLGRHPRE